MFHEGRLTIVRLKVSISLNLVIHTPSLASLRISLWILSCMNVHAGLCRFAKSELGLCFSPQVQCPERSCVFTLVHCIRHLFTISDIDSVNEMRACTIGLRLPATINQLTVTLSWGSLVRGM